LALTSSSALAASPAAGVVAQGSYRTVEIRDATGERLLARWDAHKKGVFALAFSADGTLLATGGGDEVVKVWDVSGVAGVLADPNALPLTAIPERGAYEWRLGPVRAIAFSPDGLTAAAVGDRVKFVVWDLNTARQIRK
jgi:WD40 repeat protein